MPHIHYRPKPLQKNFLLRVFGLNSHQYRLFPSQPQAQEITFEPLLDSEDAARLFGIHPKTLQKMAAMVRSAARW